MIGKGHVKIQQHDVPTGSRIIYVDASGAETDISSVVAAVHWEHEAGQLSVTTLRIMDASLELATPDVRIAIEHLIATEVLT